MDGPAFEPPTTTVAGQARGTWELGAEPPVRARVRIDGPPGELGRAARRSRPRGAGGPDGSVVVELPVTNRAAFRSFVLSFLEHAEILEPPELRDDLVAWLS